MQQYDTATEWFKINLMLFKSHISPKWENKLNLFEYNLQSVVPWEDSPSKVMLKYNEMQVLL